MGADEKLNVGLGMTKQFHEMFPAQLEAELSILAHKQAHYGLALAKAQAQLHLLEALKGPRFAELTAQAKGSSNAEKERNAEISPAWDSFIREFVSAKNTATKAKLDYEVCKTGWETARSILTSKNLERRMST